MMYNISEYGLKYPQDLYYSSECSMKGAFDSTSVIPEGGPKSMQFQNFGYVISRYFSCKFKIYDQQRTQYDVRGWQIWSLHLQHNGRQFSVRKQP
ncbi:MAG: hypothetical protein IT269_02370 [Saprospiraceae bacterium]|nr:hypothetical protein [Saprospiraceae bacterium]